MKLMSVLCTISVIATAAAAPCQSHTTNTDPLALSTQLIVVTTSNWNAVEGRLQRYERSSPRDPWRTVAEATPIVVGKNGLGWGIGTTLVPATVKLSSDPTKKEGDGKAPAGLFALGTAFGYAPHALPDTKLTYLQLGPSTECVDDITSTHYNHIVDSSTIKPDWNSSEKMRDAGESYRWGIVVDHNGTAALSSDAAPRPGGGSCIFLHIWKSSIQGTVGCTAMPIAQIEALLTWIDPRRHPLLVQLPTEAHARLIQAWKLPPVVNIPTP